MGRIRTLADCPQQLRQLHNTLHLVRRTEIKSPVICLLKSGKSHRFNADQILGKDSEVAEFES